MKFLLLMAEEDHFDRWGALDDATRERVGGDFAAFDAAVAERGRTVAGEGLAPATSARTVRPAGADGRRPVTDGPFAEVGEQLGGFIVIDVADEATALELATMLPREYSVEVRGVVEWADG